MTTIDEKTMMPIRLNDAGLTAYIRREQDKYVAVIPRAGTEPQEIALLEVLTAKAGEDAILKGLQEAVIPYDTEGREFGLKLARVPEAIQRPSWDNVVGDEVGLDSVYNAYFEHTAAQAGEKIVKIKKDRHGIHIPIAEGHSYRIVVEPPQKSFNDVYEGGKDRESAEQIYDSELVSFIEKRERARLGEKKPSALRNYLKNKLKVDYGDVNEENKASIIEKVLKEGKEGLPYAVLLGESDFDDKKRLLRYINEFLVLIDSAVSVELGYRVNDAYRALEQFQSDALGKLSTARQATELGSGLEVLNDGRISELESEVKKADAVKAALRLGHLVAATDTILTREEFERPVDEGGYGASVEDYLSELAKEQTEVKKALDSVSAGNFLSDASYEAKAQDKKARSQHGVAYKPLEVRLDDGRVIHVKRGLIDPALPESSRRLPEAKSIANRLAEAYANVWKLTLGDKGGYTKVTDYERAEITVQTLYVVAEMNEEMKKKYSAIKLGLIKPLLAELQSKIEAEEAREPSSDEERIERLKAAKQNLEDHKELSERNVVGIDEKLKGASLTKILGR